MKLRDLIRWAQENNVDLGTDFDVALPNAGPVAIEKGHLSRDAARTRLLSGNTGEDRICGQIERLYHELPGMSMDVEARIVTIYLMAKKMDKRLQEYKLGVKRGG